MNRVHASALALLLILCCFVSRADAGVVLSAAGRQQGTVATQPGSLVVGKTTVPWNEVLIAINDSQSERAAGGETLRLTNGEVWIGQVALMAGKVSFTSTSFGQAKIDLARVRTVDFASSPAPVEGEKGGVLHRKRDKNVPGTLVWIRGDRVAINTVVGAVVLKKSELTRYVNKGAAEPAANGEDELTLTDGSVLRGRVEPATDGLTIKHAILGERKVSPKAWWSVLRAADGARVISLAELKPASVQSAPLVRRPPPVPQAEQVQIGSATDFATRLRIWPKTTVVYRLPGEAGQRFTVSAVVKLDDVSRGDARVRVLVGAKPLLERVLTPQGEPAAISAEAEAGSELTLEVDFGESVAFPCNVVVDDALIVRK